MKITVDFGALWNAVNQMGAKAADFDFRADVQDPIDLDLDIALGEGIEIDLDDLDTIGGLLSHKGRQVLLYIPDQGGNIDEVLKHGEKGKKFHVADCSTLQKMRKQNRFERYIATNDINGSFEVVGTSGYGGSNKTGKAELRVCKNCLNHLNYKGYKSGPETKNTIFRLFQLAEFFARHSTIFSHIPKQLMPQTSGYSKDWSEVSRRYRAGQGHRCEQCSVDLSSFTKLLHCHHINGNKHDNSPANLQALCIDCHRRQPMHQHMGIRPHEMQRITQLRLEQGLFEDNSWDSVIDLADTSFHGLLLNYRKRGLPPPEIGYDVQDTQQEVVACVEVAWPNKKNAVVIETEVPEALPRLGWRAKTLNEAVQSFAN